MVTAMTDRQMHFIAWLITTATDKCKDIDEVRWPPQREAFFQWAADLPLSEARGHYHAMNEEIRRHSAGIKAEEDGNKSE